MLRNHVFKPSTQSNPIVLDPISKNKNPEKTNSQLIPWRTIRISVDEGGGSGVKNPKIEIVV